jgi:type II secretory pathway pseudopilin PulG
MRTNREQTRRQTLFTLRNLCVLLLFGLCCAGILSVAVSRANSDRGVFASKNELTQIEAAMEQYKIEFGSFPPDNQAGNILEHIRSQTDIEDISFVGDLATLDEKELLCFWLDGQVWNRLKPGQQSWLFFDFFEDCLRDADGDGWKECATAKGEHFIWRDGKVLLLKADGTVKGSGY